MQWHSVAVLVAALAVCIPQASAAPIKVTVATTGLVGTNAAIAFDLIDGGPPPNSVTVTAFATDGTLGSSQSTGSVTGTLPGAVTLLDTGFFSEYLQFITLGNELSFVFDSTENAPAPGALPDAFSLFLLDATTLLPLVSTSDPTGANALLLYNIGDPSPLAIYAGDGFVVTAEPVQVVPAPGTLVLALTALAAFAGLRHMTPSSTRSRLRRRESWQQRAPLPPRETAGMRGTNV
jgi:hypothetical protein